MQHKLGVFIDHKIFKEFKITAARMGKTMTELLSDFMEKTNETYKRKNND